MTIIFLSGSTFKIVIIVIITSYRMEIIQGGIDLVVMILNYFLVHIRLLKYYIRYDHSVSLRIQLRLKVS